MKDLFLLSSRSLVRIQSESHSNSKPFKQLRGFFVKFLGKKLLVITPTMSRRLFLFCKVGHCAEASARIQSESLSDDKPFKQLRGFFVKFLGKKLLVITPTMSRRLFLFCKVGHCAEASARIQSESLSDDKPFKQLRGFFVKFLGKKLLVITPTLSK
jgi:hypothetical protein